MQTINLSGQPLDLDLTLSCGQAFRWRRRSDGAWTGIVGEASVEVLVGDGVLAWRAHPGADEADIRSYFRLDDDVRAIYSDLSQCDGHLAELVAQYSGLRLLRQDPAETLLSFVCSAANSIPRITASIEALSARWGEVICETGGRCFCSFPSVEALAKADAEEVAQTAGLGFRGANIVHLAEQLLAMPPGWLDSLRGQSYEEARQGLVGLRCVGQKIADCVCLFALDKDEAVPVDTHVMQLARRLFVPELRASSITSAAYRRVREAFAERYGPRAGWAQQFLYYEDLLRSKPVRERAQ